MGKTSLKHHRLEENASVALVRDDETKVLVWRYRFYKFSKNGTSLNFMFTDYAHEEFSSLNDFRSRIEYERELEYKKIKNK